MIGMLKGFALTFRHLVGPGITQGYPQTMPQLPERARGSVAMVFGDDGKLLCRACQLCAKECPDESLHVEIEKPAEGGRVLVSMKLDLGKCMLCGLCVENCPAGALAMTPDFEHATHDPDKLVHTLYQAEERVAEGADASGDSEGATEPSSDGAAATGGAAAAADAAGAAEAASAS